jgi:hypothetical protein
MASSSIVTVGARLCGTYAVTAVLEAGLRTAVIAEAGISPVSTTEMGQAICDRI